MNTKREKKQYVSPVVEVMKLQYESCLLQGSDCPDGTEECITDTLGMVEVAKDDLA